MAKSDKSDTDAQSAAIDFTQTEEFRSAVADAAKAAAQQAVSEILARAGTMPGRETVADGDPITPATSDAKSLMEGLALAIGELLDQGTGRAGKRVSPAVLEQRRKAREAMEGLILDAQREYRDLLESGREAEAKRKAPHYELIGKVYLAETFIEPLWRDSDHRVKRTQIMWLGEPNLSMKPINESAQAIAAAFRDSIGTVEKIVADRPTGITSNGLVVTRGPTAGRSIMAPDAVNPQAGSLALLGRRGENEVVDVAVLGTAAPKARQVA